MDDDPSYRITITGAEGLRPSPVSHLTGAVDAALRYHHTTRARVALALVDDPTMAELNERHLQHAGSTDVLTFDLRNRPGASIDDDSWEIDGEVVISSDTARREAAVRDHEIEAELALYAVHGTLHLLGYTDTEPEASEAMHKMEDEILGSIGLGPVYAGRDRG